MIFADLYSAEGAYAGIRHYIPLLSGCTAVCVHRSRQDFEVFVENSYQRVDAKSFMVMFSLDYSQNLRVTADCEEAEFEAFRRQVEGAIGN
jgi:hypothetical protein